MIEVVLVRHGEAESNAAGVMNADPGLPVEYPVIPNATPQRLSAEALALAIERIEHRLRC